MEETIKKYKPQDFKSNQEIRWCAGCGDIAIISAIQKAMAEMDHKKEDYAIISGIGCSSRFPYYMNTYGFHGIHGRAGAIASGVKTANPKLSVWQITGDGDALAIGGNHFIHEIRRNLDINIILFNNQIYGLTKGQYSPTSEFGKTTKSSPFGTVEAPFHPGELTIGAQGKFFARGIDNNVKLNIKLFKAADKHQGASLVEILQNCVIFNDGAFGYISDREHKEDRQIVVEHGQPLLFGKNKDKGIILVGLKLRVAEIGKNGITEDDILVHNAHDPDPTLHLALANMRSPDFPVALGVIRDVDAPTYEERVENQIEEVQKNSKIKCMEDLMNAGNIWIVE
jgi:2-oxoglutarate/2-oxoacid ferredoxin oxidoreductase subunit beta